MAANSTGERLDGPGSVEEAPPGAWSATQDRRGPPDRPAGGRWVASRSPAGPALVQAPTGPRGGGWRAREEPAWPPQVHRCYILNTFFYLSWDMGLVGGELLRRAGRRARIGHAGSPERLQRQRGPPEATGSSDGRSLGGAEGASGPGAGPGTHWPARGRPDTSRGACVAAPGP